MVMALLAAEASHFRHVHMAKVLACRVVASLSQSWHGARGTKNIQVQLSQHLESYGW